MTLLGFSPIMAPKVANLIKLQTIRAYRKDGRDPQQCDLLQLYAGLRRPGAQKLLDPDPMCIIAGDIRIRDARTSRFHGGPMCSVIAAWPRPSGNRKPWPTEWRRRRKTDGELWLGRPADLDHFARADGFRDFDAMLEWFCPDGEEFRGTLTHWRPHVQTIRGWRP
jgi:hypothetical protein